MKKIALTVLAFVIGTASVTAQHLSSSQNSVSLGVGTGLPYGGIGAKVGYNPADHFTVFGGMGYNLVGLGINGGLQLAIPSQKQTEFYFTGMYGYNSVIVLKDASGMGLTYYGPSFGMGIKINSLSSEGSYWDLGILAPIRSRGYKDDIEEMEQSPYIHIESKPWPVLFYLGYNFNIGAKK